MITLKLKLSGIRYSKKLGLFAGPGFVFGGPGGSVIKAIPFLNYQDDKFGFGGMLKV